MSKNVQIVQKIYDDFGKGDVPAIAEVLASDIKWAHYGSPELPYAKKRNGKQQAVEFFSDLNNAVEVTKFEVNKYISEADTVVALGHWGGKAKGSGKEFESDWAMVWTFEDSKVKVYQAFEDTNAIAKAFKA